MKVWVQKWEESERGWGTRPDGYTLHKEKADIQLFLAEMRAREARIYNGAIPDEYSRPCGEPYETEISDPAIYAQLSGSNGIYGRTKEYPEPLISDADKTGWVQL